MRTAVVAALALAVQGLALAAADGSTFDVELFSWTGLTTVVPVDEEHFAQLLNDERIDRIVGPNQQRIIFDCAPRDRVAGEYIVGGERDRLLLDARSVARLFRRPSTGTIFGVCLARIQSCAPGIGLRSQRLRVYLRGQTKPIFVHASDEAALKRWRLDPEVSSIDRDCSSDTRKLILDCPPKETDSYELWLDGDWADWRRTLNELIAQYHIAVAPRWRMPATAIHSVKMARDVIVEVARHPGVVELRHHCPGELL